MVHFSKAAAAAGCSVLCLLFARAAQANFVEPSMEGETVALIQQKAEKMDPRRRKGMALDTAVSTAQVNATVRSGPTFMESKDCVVYPSLCAAPFDCDKLEITVGEKWSAEGWAADGKPNFRSWCMDMRYEPYASRCAAGDIAGAGLVQYQLTIAGTYGPDVDELDGSYCFMDGHCVNTAVTNDTTVEEMVEMCDERFGRENWATFGSATAPPENAMGYGTEELHGDYSNGFQDPKQTRPYMLAACAMGNYHCDVLYCKNYCNNEYYMNKYGHLLKQYGWVP